jgi:glycosyltransferase XagB
VQTTQKPETAARLLSTGQVILGIAVVVEAIAVAAAFGPVLLLKVAVALATALYIGFVGFKFVIWHAAARPAGSHGELPATDDPDLPRYTVLLPLYGEASILGKLVTGLSGLRYPAEKLQILLLLEKDDHQTQAAEAAMDLPP